MLRALVLLLLLLLGSAAAIAEDEPKKAPAKPLTDEQAADAVLAAVKAKDAEALKTLAEKDEPDPWLVADLLCYRGEHDAAEAFAKAAPRVDTEKLPAYVQAWRKREPDKTERELLVAMNAAFYARQSAKIMEGTAALNPTLDTVVRVRLRHSRGSALWMLRRWEECEAMHRSAADAALTLGWLGRASRLLNEAGFGAYYGSAFARALASWEKGLALAERRADKVGAADTLGNIGLVYESRGDYAKALSTYEQALAQKQALGDKAGAAGTLGNIGLVYGRLGDYAKALSTNEQALAQMEALGDKAGAAGTLVNIGSVYVNLGDYAKALSYLERGLALAEEIGHRQFAANALGNIGTVCVLLGDYAKALSTYEQVLAQKQALGDRAGAAMSLGNIGALYSSLGDYARALSTYEQALAQNQALGAKQGTAGTLVNIGSAYMSLGDYAKALSYYERGLALAEEIGHRRYAVNARANIGLVYESRGDYAKALSTFEQALAQKQALGDKQGVVSTLSNISNIYNSLGDYAKALSTFEQALAQMEALGDKAGAAGTLVNIGSVYVNLGDYAKALSCFERGLALAEEIGHRQFAVNALGNLGIVYGRLGDYAKALSTYEQTLAQKQALGDKRGAARTLGEIGGVYGRLGDYAKARGFLEKSARAAKSLRATPTLVHALTRLARLHLRQGEPSRALGAAREALTATETLLAGLGQEQGATARGEHASLFAVGALAAVREEDAAEAMTFLESGRAGALLDALDKREALRWKAESLSPELRRLDLEAAAKESAARHAYDRAVQRGKLQETRAVALALDEATEGVRAVAGRIQRDLKQQAGLFYPRAKTIEEIEATLATDQALVLYGFFLDDKEGLDEALALVLRHDGERIVSLGKASAVAAACEELDATDVSADASAALDALRKLVVDPLKLGKGVKQVLVSPEGPLCYVPFGALFEQTIAMTPSGTTHVLLLGEEREPGKGILALGEPDYGGASKAAQAIYYRGRTLSPLPATRKEVETIGTKTLLGAKASEAELRDALPASKRWRAVHFACHGLVDVERPMLSSLALSHAGDDDGFLTALEILRTKIPADLAVLSACETGKGKIVKGEGIVGLTRAFMFAGAPRVIASLWKVDDEATQALMIKFYELWNPKDGKGLGAAAGLKQAQAFVRDHPSGKWKHPFYWAAWVLWGLPR